MALLFIAFNILILTTSSISCGDGINGSPPQSCTASSMDCLGFEQCATDTLTCSISQECSITCSGETKSCFGTTIDASNSNGLTLICDEDSNTIEGCKQANIYAPVNKPLDITCNGGQYSCTGLTVYGTVSSAIDIVCSGYNSCLGGVEIWCGSDSCDVECSGGHACTGLKLYCATSDCTINCGSDAQNPCLSVVVDASYATDFECTGQCQQVYDNLLSAAPTDSNTNSPTTSIPTTSVPTTVQPTTFMPTAVPTTNIPTTAVPTTNTPTTNVPTTNNPTTFMPTTTAPTTTAPTTNIPTTTFPTTMFPTSGIPTTYNPTTRVPSNNPIESTAIPTQMPTKKPTVKPTKGGEGGIDEKSTLAIDATNDSDRVIAGNTENTSWIYAVIAVCSVIILVIGVIIFMRHKKKKQKENVMQNVKAIALGSLSPTNDEGNGMKFTIPVNNKENMNITGNQFQQNILMDDMGTPMGPNDGCSNVQMNIENEGDIITVGADAEGTDDTNSNEYLDDDEDVLNDVNEIQTKTPMGDEEEDILNGVNEIEMHTPMGLANDEFEIQ